VIVQHANPGELDALVRTNVAGDGAVHANRGGGAGVVDGAIRQSRGCAIPTDTLGAGLDLPVHGVGFAETQSQDARREEGTRDQSLHDDFLSRWAVCSSSPVGVDLQEESERAGKRIGAGSLF
jgi:hypothetical protein